MRFSPHLIFKGIFTLLELAPASRLWRDRLLWLLRASPSATLDKKIPYFTDPYYLCQVIFLSLSFLSDYEPNTPCKFSAPCPPTEIRKKPYLDHVPSSIQPTPSWRIFVLHGVEVARAFALFSRGLPLCLTGKDSKPVIAEAKTSHFRQIFIFWDQLS